MRRATWRLAVAGSLALIVLAAWTLRSGGRAWDANQHQHPDERFLTMTMNAERWPSSVGEYLSELRSPLNPRNVGSATFVYGTLPTTMAKGVSVAMGQTSYDATVLVGRALSSAADTLTVVFVFLIAITFHRDARVALLAAWLYAVAVLAIQHAHFFVVDPFVTCFLAASLWALARASVSGRWWNDAAVGACLGLALATKISAAALVVPIALMAWRRDGLSRFGLPLLRTAAIVGVAALVVLRVAAPDMFDGWLALSPRWLANMSEARRMASGEIDMPPGAQWAGRAAYWFPWKNMVLWGLGPLLGLAAWAGWAAAAWRWLRHGDWRHALLVSWVGVTFLAQGGQFVTTLRYFLPLYPALCVLAAWGLVAAWDRSSGRPRRRIVAALAIAVVVAGTAVWAIAFTSIYRRPNTRVAASAWIYEHVPAGARLAIELWDDPLPVRLDNERTPARYVSVQLANYDTDSPEKLDRLIAVLDRTDVVILASNRLYDSIPRLPMRYPMTIRYYRMLFDGSLGFTRAADFTSYPGIGGWTVPDQGAEEAFSVYDHARVQVFRKTGQWNAASARASLGDGIDWQAIVPLPAAKVASFKNGLMLTPEEAAAARASGTWSRLFDPAGFANRRPVVTWVLALVAIGLGAYPLAWLCLPAAWDRGWLLSRPLGVLIVAYLSWLAASLHVASFGRGSVLLSMSVMAAAAFVAWRRERCAMRIWWTVNRGIVLREEALFWTAFVAFLWIRQAMPELWHPYFGGEKPMDLAFLNAVVRSPSFPPYDPWLAGGAINYYYFGFVMSAALVHLTSIVPAVAYNLLIPTIFAFAVAGACTVASTLGSALADHPSPRPWWRSTPLGAGIACALLLAVLGNLEEVRVLVAQGTSVKWWLYWNATRVIPAAPGEAAPITEFPFFTFLYGDLHAHMLALPLTLVSLAASASLVVDRAARSGRRTWPTVTLLALATGALAATNAWDYPTFVGLGLVAVWISTPDGRLIDRARLAAGPLMLVAIGGRLLFSPFFSRYAAPVGLPQIWRGSHTTLDAYLAIHGLFLFILASWAFAWWRGRQREVAFREAAAQRAASFATMLAVGGLLLTLLVELVVVDAVLGRMNTVFKFYYQVWTLWSVAAAFGLAVTARHWRPTRAGFAWAAALALLVLGAATYPVVATRARIEDRFAPGAPPTLDGEAYMRYVSHTERNVAFTLDGDLEAIEWLRANAEGSPVVAEAQMEEYRWGSRISVYTGLPTIVGWSWHERQQRAGIGDAMVARRIADVQALFTTTDANAALALLRRYHVRYVVVGALERVLYPAEGLAKFGAEPRMFTRVFSGSGTEIFEVAGAP